MHEKFARLDFGLCEFQSIWLFLLFPASQLDEVVARSSSQYPVKTLLH